MTLEAGRRPVAAFFAGLLALSVGAGGSLLATCGPFTDVAADVFCPFVLEIFFLGITTGTTPTTYDPASNVSRLQMAAFLSRTVDGVLKRGNRRAALDQFWTTQSLAAMGLTTVGNAPQQVRSDGADLWVANNLDSTVSRVRGSDGRLLETWTGATNAVGVLTAMGKVFVTGYDTPGRLYRIDPTQPVGSVTTVASTLGGDANGIAFDGARIWTANVAGSVSIVTPGPAIPWTVTTVSGFVAAYGISYDGSNIWVTDVPGNLLKLDGGGSVLQTVTVGSTPLFPIFDGANIWVPNVGSDSVSVVRASSGVVLATLTGNGLSFPFGSAFDGQRVVIASAQGNAISLWKAADLTPLGFLSMPMGSAPAGACSDGVHFWITLAGTDHLARF